MEHDQAAPPEPTPRPSARRAKPDALFVIVIWGRVVVGLALSAVGGVAFGHAWTTDYLPWWLVGAVSLLTGVLLILSAAYARSRPPDTPLPPPAAEAASEQPDPLVPLVGALLVYKFRYVTQEQLNRALELQRRRRNTGHRIGEVLVQMGAVTRPQLQEALSYQRAEADRKRRVTQPPEPTGTV